MVKSALPMTTDQSHASPTLADLQARRDEILALAAQHGATNVRVFGSVARIVAASDQHKQPQHAPS